ncbi:MAG: hypothetical protein ACD_23C00188G0001, partial [uncultured bacterium]
MSHERFLDVHRNTCNGQSVKLCRIPDDHMVAYGTDAGAPGTNPSWLASA